MQNDKLSKRNKDDATMKPRYREVSSQAKNKLIEDLRIIFNYGNVSNRELIKCKEFLTENKFGYFNKKGFILLANIPARTVISVIGAYHSAGRLYLKL